MGEGGHGGGICLQCIYRQNVHQLADMTVLTQCSVTVVFAYTEIPFMFRIEIKELLLMQWVD